MTQKGQRKILFFVAVDWYFCLHWLPLAKAVRDAGFDVCIMTEVTDPELGQRIRRAGLRLIPIRLSRKGLNPLAELRSLYGIWRVLRNERPNLLHAIAQKPVVYGALAARLAGIQAVVGTLAGMGFLFTSEGLKARALRPAVVFAYRRLLGGRNVRVIVQNPEDGAQLRREANLDSVLIRGAGVDLERFKPAQVKSDAAIVVLASRMLWDKGVQEFVDAARLLRGRGSHARLVLVGKPDSGNPSAVPLDRLQRWHDQGEVEWWGHREDMPAVLARAHVCCLPSYREGLPTILIEAAAAGLPLVATDVPGCREVVHPGINGLLVPVRDATALANALETLICAPALREQYGSQSRVLAEAEFGIGHVASATLDVYRSVL
jgi:glycosyltransferase involved in cell wall biosynthesis